MMNRKHILFLITAIVGLLLTGCKSSEDGPEDIYWKYWEACSNGRFTVARAYVVETSESPIQMLGVCGFTHDAVNTLEQAGGRPPRTYSEGPEVYIEEETASLVWIDDQGNVSQVGFVKVQDEWKINEAAWTH